MQRLMRFLAIVLATLAPPIASSAQSAQQQLNGTTTSLQRVAAGTGLPLWAWIVLAVVVILLVLLALARRRRSQAVIKTRLG
jgi:type II secretory pathway component PulF